MSEHGAGLPGFEAALFDLAGDIHQDRVGDCILVGRKTKLGDLHSALEAHPTAGLKFGVANEHGDGFAGLAAFQ